MRSGIRKGLFDVFFFRLFSQTMGKFIELLLGMFVRGRLVSDSSSFCVFKFGHIELSNSVNG